MIQKPCEGYITSEFGKDVLNGMVREHYGIDLAKPGVVPIHAVEDGIVSKSYLSTSYGECIRIIHNIHGQQWESLYAHMKSGSRQYREGQRVKRGSIIGYMGSTGYSTGQHLHFEFHKGSWNINKSNSVNPLLYFDKEQYLNLHPHMESWNVYKTNVQPVKKNVYKELKPKKYHGLSYKIIAKPYKNVYTIETEYFGKVNIYAPRDRDSSITDTPKYNM